jgi:two-component system, NarL family, invasion response regulator UvrY
MSDMRDTSDTIAVLVVDDHAVVREGYRRLLERASDLRVVGEADCAAAAQAAFIACKPDVVVMDISLPDVSGIELLRRLLARDPSARILMFSIHEETIYADRAFAAGACGYVTKASAPDVLVEAVREVAARRRYLSPDVARALALDRLSGGEDPLQSLSPREFEIARLLANGHTVHGIASRLCLNYKTVANYQTAIRQKLGVETTVQLARIAVRSGLVWGEAERTGAG